MRVFITGGHGFVGRWLREHLAKEGDDVIAPLELEITDEDDVASALKAAQPDAIYHLAALTHVGQSWQQPDETFRVNAVGTLRTLEAVRRVSPSARVLVVGSAEVYGHVTPDQLPVGETAPVRPVSPYAASKAAAEIVALQAHLGHGLDVVQVRSFNHVGPGQSPDFVVSALARRVAEAAASGSRSIRVGNLEPRRDFTDVRDVVRAYRLLVEKGTAGEIYNVCSGHDVSVGELANRLARLAGVELELVPDPELVRPVDVPVLRGDPAKLVAATGWRPQLSLDQTLQDILELATSSPSS
jgi:GDP-4-dehydro-6-deoxy-D-mannose reductase